MPPPNRLSTPQSIQDFIAYYAANPGAPGIDVGGSPISILYPHHEVHEGNFYTLSRAGTIAAGTANALMFAIRPGAGLTAHFQAIVSAKNSGNAELWENATFVASGTLIPFNNSRTSPNLFAGTVVTIDTLLTLGTMLQGRAVGSNAPGTRIGGEGTTRNEWILNPSYWYFIWFYADNADTQVTVDAEFYEQTNYDA